MIDQLSIARQGLGWVATLEDAAGAIVGHYDLQPQDAQLIPASDALKVFAEWFAQPEFNEYALCASALSTESAP